MTKLKKSIWNYMVKHGMSYREMAKKLGEKNHNGFFVWMTRENETLTERIVRNFDKLNK